MGTDRIVRVSKLLSRVLRHDPASVGVTLDAQGWVPVPDLLAALAAHGRPLTRAQLDEVVDGNDKRRFTIDGDRIRANQGHSLDVDLALTPLAPPETLYHGTAERNLASIRRDGLHKARRHHVHLSADTATARRVGARHGKPVVLTVRAGAMHADGYVFYRSANGVWLTDGVPVGYVGEGQTGS